MGLTAGLVAGFATFGAVLGASLGVMQWLVLRRQLSRSGWWILAGSVGGAVSFP